MAKRAVDHEKFLRNIQTIAKAEEFDRKDKETYVPKVEEKKCTTCGSSRTCKKYRGKMSFEGTYSVGGDSDTMTCDKWMPKKKDSVKKASEIKGLMKQFKRSLY
jgi:hypothetical protein